MSLRYQAQLRRAEYHVQFIADVVRRFAQGGPEMAVALEMLRAEDQIGGCVRSCLQYVSTALSGANWGVLGTEGVRSRAESRPATARSAQNDPLCSWDFAVAIQRDYDAVRAALEEDWSSGQVEGQITRVKFIKRRMYGRANFDLLRQHILCGD